MALAVIWVAFFRFYLLTPLFFVLLGLVKFSGRLYSDALSAPVAAKWCREDEGGSSAKPFQERPSPT